MLSTSNITVSVAIPTPSHLPFLISHSPQQSVTLVSPWIRNSHLLPTSTRFAVPVTTCSVNFAQFPAHLPLLPQPPLSIPFSLPGSTTVVPFTLVSLLLA